MPIRPSQRDRYPPNWREISDRIRFERAEGRCECTGQCDDEHPGGRCNAEHNSHVIRHNDTPALWRTLVDLSESLNEHGDEGIGYGHKSVRIVLTVAHLDHTPENVDDANLLACCQRCHLRIDRFEHAANARATRHRKAGQVELFGEDGS